MILNAGGPQTWFELVPLLEDEEFKIMLIQYGEFYFLSPEEKRVAANNLISGEGFEYPYMASSMAGYASACTKNKK